MRLGLDYDTNLTVGGGSCSDPFIDAGTRFH